jgi:ABC-type multidrug transport system fused ATPase/permease subunit
MLLINRLCGLVLPASTKYLVDDVLGRHRLPLLVPLLAAIFASYLVQGITTISLNQLLTKASQQMVTRLRIALQGHLLRLPLSFHGASKTGSLLSRVMSDVEGLRNLASTGVIDFLGSIATAFFAIGLLFTISRFMTTVVLLALALYGLILCRSLAEMRALLVARRELTAEVAGRLNESLNGIRVVKAYRLEQSENDVFARGANRLLANTMATVTNTSLLGLLASITVGVLTVTVMFVGVKYVLSGSLSLGTFLTYLGFIALLIAPVSQLIIVGPQLMDAAAALERTRELHAHRTEDDDCRRSMRLSRVDGYVAFEHVHFEYESGKPVLHDINFRALPGTVTALVGPSGAGKSTIVNLLAGFLVPSSGRILMDDTDISGIDLQSLRQQLGVVFQETFLFDGSIYDNIAFAFPASNREKVMKACRLSGVSEFAERLEHGYDTVIGERGFRLSGGEKQRLSIARAILADPRILILDEATSHLDSESEELIQVGLRHLRQGRTTFIIAHRLSTVRDADQILLLESGSIVERGCHELLFQQGGRYYALCVKQQAHGSTAYEANVVRAGALLY